MPQKCKSAPRRLPKIVGILIIPRRKLYLSLTVKANKQISFLFKVSKKKKTKCKKMIEAGQLITSCNRVIDRLKTLKSDKSLNEEAI